MWLKEGLTQPANDEPVNNERLYNDDKPKSPIQVFHYHNDHLGTPNELTNQDGEVIWLADYEAYGNTAKVIWREERLESLQVSADELQPIRFQGQSFDTETGLHYNRFRYFDPDLGMFTTRDPIGLLGGMNVFQYAPNPVGWIDPFGLSCTNNFSDLSRTERQALMNQRLEANALRRLQEMQSRHPQAHFLDRHGANTSLQSQFNRATRGIDPTTGLVRTRRNGNVILPPSATRFTSNRDQLNAINRAEQIFKNTNNKDLSDAPINFGRNIGEGYNRQGIYGTQNTAVVKVDESTGLAITAFPKF